MLIKLIISDHSEKIINTFIPTQWNNNYLIMTVSDFFEMNPFLFSKYEIYYLSDPGYDIVSKLVNQPDKGNCHKLSLLCNDKYICRKSLYSLQDIPYKICNDNKISWPEDIEEKLIAKPVNGTASNGIMIVKHNDIIENINNETYLVEKYIDDKYPRVSVDGYICNGEIGILSIWDNIYNQDEPTKFKYLIFPSKFSENSNIIEKYKTVVKELHKKTGCNNQIIDIEFFLVDTKPMVMEINPRVGGNYLPIYHITGYNNFLVCESLIKGINPKKTERMGKGICRYNYEKCNNNNIVINGSNQFCFSVNGGAGSYYHTYIYSYSKQIIELQNIVEEEFDKIKKI